jgi:hypothetical protein
MSASSALPAGLKNEEAEKGTLGHKSPVRYVPEKSLLGDDEISEKQTSYKFKLPDRIGSGEHLIWKGGTSEKFLVHVASAKAIVAKMGIWKEYDDALAALSNAHEKLKKCYRKVNPTWDPTSDEDGYLVDAFLNIPKKPASSEGEDDTEDAAVKAKRAYNKAREALNLANEEPANAAKKAFELYNNLLGEDEQTAWQQIVKQQTETDTYTDVYGVKHDVAADKDKTSFHECVIFHLLSVFRMDAGEQLRKYVDKVVKKPNRLPIRHHVKRVQELNRYIGHLPCLHYSSKNANGTLDKVKPFDDAELAGLILEHVPESWRVDRDKMIDDIPRSTRKLLDELEKIEASRKEEERKRANDRDPKRKAAKALERPIPKKKRTENSRNGTPKNCALCEKHGGAHKTHNTSQCRKYNTDGTRKKDSNQSGNRESKKTRGHSYAQLSERCEKLEQKLKKAHKRAEKRKFKRDSSRSKKRHDYSSDDSYDSDSS